MRSTLADLGSHVFDLALHLAGPIARVCGTTSIIIPERPDPARPGATRPVDNDDAFAALAEFAGGASGILDANRVATGSRGELTFDVVGSQGAVRWDFRRMNELQVCFADTPEAEQGFTTIQTSPANWPYGRFIPSPLGLGYADTKVIEAYRVVDALAKGEAISPSIGDVLAVARLIDAVQRGGWAEIANRAAGRRPAASPSRSSSPAAPRGTCRSTVRTTRCSRGWSRPAAGWSAGRTTWWPGSASSTRSAAASAA